MDLDGGHESGAWRRAGLLLLLPCLAARPAGAAFIDSNLAVSPAAHANGGGCYPVALVPGLLDMLTLINPEWAAIDVGAHLPPVSDPVTIRGTIALAKINEGGDFPGDHQSDDQNTFIEVDPADMPLVGTGNVGPRGVEAGQVEVEWEIGKYPLAAWGGTGDRLTAIGRWIWDCGHPDPDPAGSCSTTVSQECAIDADCAPPTCPACLPGETCTGVTFNYHSEVHPPQAVAVSRVGRAYAFSKNFKGGRQPSTRTDVWISSDGGGAGDQCVLTHLADPLLLLGTDCTPFGNQLANVNASNFAFDVPLPPQPPGNTLPPRVRVKDRTPKGLPKASVTTTYVAGPTPVVHAVVDMTTPVKGVLPSQVGKIILARWRKDSTPVTRLQVHVNALEVVNPLKAVTPASSLKKRCSVTTSQDCSVTPCPGGEQCLTLGGPTPGWQIFLEANGEWRELPGLGAIDAPVTIPLGLTYDLAVPVAGGSVNLHASGKSFGCLEAQLYGTALPRALALYGLIDGAACLGDSSKDIGQFNLTFNGPDFGSGSGSQSYVTQSTGGDGGSCSVTTSQLCLTSADCPGGETCNVTGGAFKLHYTIRKVR